MYITKIYDTIHLNKFEVRFIKVIFLDIEGVLNTKETYERVYKILGHTTMIDVEIDKFRLEYLRHIIDNTGAKIVLSSSFRYFFKKENDKVLPITLKGKKIYDILMRYGIEIYDKTPNTMGSREAQIQNWLLNRDDIESFVIIDDDPTEFDQLLDKLVQTCKVRRNYLLSFMKESIGLCERHVEEVVDRLNNKTKVLKR